MNKLKLASLTLLLAGATALPAAAQDGRRAAGEPGWVGSEQPGGREYREARAPRPGDRGAERREDRREWQADRREDRRDWQADRREDRRDAREDRREWQADRRDDRREWRDDRREWRDDRREWRDDRRDWRRDQAYARHRDPRWNGNTWYPQYRYRAPARYVYPSGYRPYRWSVGHRLPPAYYHRNYYVDYNSYRLPPPPYGYHWVRVDRDVVLVALATGLIRDVLYGIYY